MLVSSPVKAAAKKKRDEKEGKGKTKRERKVEGKEPSPRPQLLPPTTRGQFHLGLFNRGQVLLSPSFYAGPRSLFSICCTSKLRHD